MCLQKQHNNLISADGSELNFFSHKNAFISACILETRWWLTCKRCVCLQYIHWLRFSSYIKFRLNLWTCLYLYLKVTLSHPPISSSALLFFLIFINVLHIHMCVHILHIFVCVFVLLCVHLLILVLSNISCTISNFESSLGLIRITNKA